MSKILIYTKGDRMNGFGHVMRCLTLAEHLRTLGADIAFATWDGTPGLERIRQAGWPVIVLDGDARGAGALEAAGENFDAVVIDIEHGPEAGLLRRLRPRYRRIITLSGVGYACRDPEAQGKFVDLRIVQSIQPDEPIGRERILSGIEYIIIAPEFAACTPDPDGHIVVAMGGGDPHGLTEVAAEGLRRIGRRVICVTGQARPAPDAPAAGPRQHIVWQHGLPSLVPVLDGAVLCVCALGMTTYESLAAGVLVVMTSLSADHERTAYELAARGVGVTLGLWDHFMRQSSREAVEGLLAEGPELWRARSGQARRLVDGRGAERCARAILEI